MDKNWLTKMMYEYIQASYPTGGYASFITEGGEFLVDPLIDDQVFIYHPNLPKKLKNNLLRRSQLSFKFINSINFKNLSDKEIESNIWDATIKLYREYGLNNILHEYKNKIALFISIKDDGLSDEIIESISHTLLSLIPELIRGFIIYDHEIYPFGNFNTTKNNIVEPAVIPSCIGNTKKRDTVINHDDIINTIINLNTTYDVLDFIQKV